MTDASASHDGRRPALWRRFDPSPVPGPEVERRPLVVVGTGPVGLALAIDMGLKGHRVVLLGKQLGISGGSRAICFAKRSLDIFDRLGVGAAVVEKGVVWNVGKVFWKDGTTPIYSFDMLPVKNQKMPGFVNLQQYYLEELLVARAGEIPGIEIRWGHSVSGVRRLREGAAIEIEAPNGDYRIEADWVVACDGNRSSVRSLLGLDFDGRAFEDNFLIADIRMKGDHSDERRFWFDPPFNPGRSVLMHKQPDDIWRIDFQLGWDIDRAACVRPENVEPRVRAMLGPDVAFSEEWYSVYTFQCRRMESFVHGRVLFAGDSAHLVSPFGARGCNGGFADIDNLAWKLDLVMRGGAGPHLLRSYDAEALVSADENILNSTRSTDFLTPKSSMSECIRDSVLELARKVPFARRFVNSGRLSTPVSYPASLLNTTDLDDWGGAGVAPGLPPLDAPLGSGWLLEQLGSQFTLVSNGPAPGNTSVQMIDVSKAPEADALVERYALPAGAAYLFRPDQYVAARWKSPNGTLIEAAIARAKGFDR